MTKNEQELIDVIQSSHDPVKATMIAIDVICQWIERPLSSQLPSAADPPVPDGIVQA